MAFIKAHLVTYNESGDEIKKRKKLDCWITWSEKEPVVEVALTEDGVKVQQSVYIDFKSLMKEVEQYEQSK